MRSAFSSDASWCITWPGLLPWENRDPDTPGPRGAPSVPRLVHACSRTASCPHVRNLLLPAQLYPSPHGNVTSPSPRHSQPSFTGQIHKLSGTLRANAFSHFQTFFSQRLTVDSPPPNPRGSDLPGLELDPGTHFLSSSHVSRRQPGLRADLCPGLQTEKGQES